MVVSNAGHGPVGSVVVHVNWTALVSLGGKYVIVLLIGGLEEKLPIPLEDQVPDAGVELTWMTTPVPSHAS